MLSCSAQRRSEGARAGNRCKCSRPECTFHVQRTSFVPPRPPADRWARGAAAQLTAHKQALSTWLYLSGRCDCRALEATAQRLIGGGLDAVGGSGDPYQLVFWATLQVG